MGMFWLHNPKIRFSNIFPSNLSKKVWVNFCCRGKECKKENEETCTFLHPRSTMTDLKLSPSLLHDD
jgi:hypothetical protein